MKRQAGAVLLVFVALLIVAFAAVLLGGLNMRTARTVDRGTNRQVLKQAIDALLGYALVYAEYNAGSPPGSLPCPDTDGDGLADAPCGGADESVIGRLPWQTLGLPPLRDATSECLWYAVSGSYKEQAGNSPSSATNGLLVIRDAFGGTLVGDAPDNRAIALVIAPGRAIAGQVRARNAMAATECASTNPADQVNRPVNYLDSFNTVSNADGSDTAAGAGQPGEFALPTVAPSVFVSVPADYRSGAVTYNDELAWITPAAFAGVHRHMDRWVADRVQRCVAAYGVAAGGFLPWAASLNAATAPDYSDDDGERFGRIPSDLTHTAGYGLPSGWTLDPLDGASTCFGWGWWSSWREQVLFAIDRTNAPAATTGGTIRLDGGASSFVVAVGGRALTGQARESNVERATASNYLEADNVPGSGTGNIPPGDEDFVTAAPGDFNDVTCGATGCP